MSVMRVKKDKNYTVISNGLLQDKDISLKAKGLLCVMLSLPDKWEFSIAGLAAISHEGETSIRSTLQELERNRYLERGKVKDENNKVVGWDYIVYEKKFNEKDRVYKDEANRVYADRKKKKPCDESPVVGNNHVESERQLSTNKESTQQESNYISHQTDSSASDAPIPAESVRKEKQKSLWDISREITGNDPFTFPYQPTSDSEEKSAAGIVKEKPLVKNLTDMDDKDIKLLRAALLGKAYGMAIIDDVPFSMQCGTDHGVATLTMEGAFDYWLDHALYRESARDAYLSKFLEAWKNICDNCADRFWMPARGGDGYVWQNVIKGYANNWNPGTPSERREAKANDAFNNP
nr:MAG TPA: Dna polymerase B [Bacteriophage sp.]